MKPEARFVSLVNSKLAKFVHHQSMAHTVINGTPDQYYDLDPRFLKGGQLRTCDLWVEYKWLPNPPHTLLVPNCSELQKAWLSRRWSNGGNAWVVVGFPTTHGSRNRSCVVFYAPVEWEKGLQPFEFELMTPQALADKVAKYVSTPVPSR